MKRGAAATLAWYAAALAAWQAAAWLVHNGWLVGPVDIARVFLDPRFDSRLATAYAETCSGAVAGFALGLLAGLGLGLLGGLLATPLSGFLESAATLAASVPGIAWIPLLIAIFGTSASRLPVTASFLSCFPPILYQTFHALKTIDVEEVAVAKTLGAEGPFLWRTIILPRVFEKLFPAVKIEAVMAWKIVFAVEMVAGTSGLGYMAMIYADLLDVPHVAAIVVVLTATVVAVVEAVTLVENRVLRRRGMGVEPWRSSLIYVEQGY